MLSTIGIAPEIGASNDASVQKPPSTPVLGADVSESIEPISTATSWYSGSTFGFGIVHDVLTNRTKDRFTIPGPHILASYGEAIRGPWSGQIQVVVGTWDGIKGNDAYFASIEEPETEFTAMRIMTSVELAPLGKLPASSLWTKMNTFARPVVFAGPGYLTFFRTRGLLPDRVDGLSGEAAFRWGVALRTVLPGTLAATLSFEKWRGVKTFDFSAQAIALSFELGDVDAR